MSRFAKSQSDISFSLVLNAFDVSCSPPSFLVFLLLSAAIMTEFFTCENVMRIALLAYI